jgi:O-antigen ligase
MTSLLRLMVPLAVVPCAVGLAEFALGRIYGHLEVMQAIYGSLAPQATQGFAVYEVGGGLLPRGTPSTFTFVAQYFGYLQAMLVACYAVWRADPAPGWRRFGQCMLVIVALAALLTGARSAFVFVPFLLLLAFGLHRGFGATLRATALIGGLLAAAVSLLHTGFRALFEHVADLFVTYGKGTAYELLVRALVSAPLGMGTGTNTGPARYAFPDPSLFEALENYYAKATYELGIPGLLLIVGLFGLLIHQGFQARRRVQDRTLRACASALLAFFITIALSSFKGWPIDLDPTNVYFWVFAGLLLKLPYLDSPPAESKPAEELP